MRKHLLIGFVIAAPILAFGATPSSAHGWYGYGYGRCCYYAPRAYYRPAFYYRPRFIYGGSYRPRYWGWRGYSYYQPFYRSYYGPRFYRPRIWAWRGWGGRAWGWRGGWRRW